MTGVLIRFHWAAGARVALRANAMVAGVVVFLFGSAPDALATLRTALIDLVATGHGWNARMQFAAICVALAGAAAPRITLGATGWMRSLSISSNASRRAAIVGLFVSQAFAIVLAFGACVMVTSVYHTTLSPARIVALPLILFGAASVVLPVTRVSGRVLGFVALALAIPGTWLLSALSVGTLMLSDRASGRIVSVRRRVRDRARTILSRTHKRRSWVPQWIAISCRALPAVSTIGTLILPAIFIAFGYFIVRHNPDISVAMATRTVRICGSLAAMTLTVGLANLLLRSRPSWTWSRSLPWSSIARVTIDACMLGVPLITIPVLLAPLAPWSALAVGATLPAIAASAAAALRAGANRQAGAASEIVGTTVVAGTAIALWPLASLAILLVTPLFIMLAARRERRRSVTRWFELQHDSAGDPAWLGAR